MKSLWKSRRRTSTILLRCGDIETNPGPSTAGQKPRSEFRNPKKMLRFVHLNARSLVCHFDEVACLVSSVHPDVLALSETWLDSSVGNGELYLSGYTLHRCDRSRCGGGVAVYCANHLSCSLLSCGPSASGLEYLWVTIDSRLFCSPLVFGCFYRPPNLPTQSVNDACNNIECMMTTKKNIIASGDFNVDMSDMSKPYSKFFSNFLDSHSLQQPIDSHTHFSPTTNSILDLFIATSDIPISNSSVLNLTISDHLPILLDVDYNVPKASPHIVTRRSCKHFSRTCFEKDLANVPWSVIDIFDSPDDKVDVFNSLFLDVLDLHAPLKTIRIKKKTAPWITKHIRNEMDHRNKLYKLFKKNPLTVTWDAFKTQRNRVTALQRKAKKEYFHRLIWNKADPSTLWNTLKAAGVSSSPQENWSCFNMNSTSVADTLNTHFVSISSAAASGTWRPSPPALSTPPPSTLSLASTTPAWCEETLASLKTRCSIGLDGIPSFALKAGRSVISYPLSSILNSSISSAIFPAPWKCAWVKPLHKGGDRVSPSNYRPISLLPVCSKLLEKCVQQQLSSHFLENDLLFPFQSGFRPTHSTQTLLLHCLDEWYKALDRKQYIGVVFLDITKAFDTVDHYMLLSKLSQLGLSPSAASWFKSYLSHRSQVTRVDDSYSSPGFPTSGVPQGSVLGPSLFSAFINDLPSVLPPDSVVLFADDTAIYIINSNLSSLNASLQKCLDAANLWMARNGLRLNENKTKCMLIHSSKAKAESGLDIHIDDVTVEQVRSLKYLGVVLNDTLTWSDHVDMVCGKVNRSLNLLRRLSWFLPRSLLFTFLKSYILPHFDYCDVVWSGCNLGESRRLDVLLNFACKVVLRRQRDSSSTAALQELGLTNLTSRRKLHIAQCVFRCLSCQSPPYLTRLFPSVSSHHNTRSSSTSQLNLPLLRTSTGQKAFSFAGASLWRTLPPATRQEKNFKKFSEKCKNFFSPIMHE